MTQVETAGKKNSGLQDAYALNLCMVSVSQIVDYDDIYILEQEYDTILNNLNLENMPKDEALLNILKELLNTITYFKIQEGDKKFIELEYQHKMKNAIWNAVPNFAAVGIGNNPVTMAISLATQVGIGYMNYRRTKAENNLEHEKQKWQLQRSAMEQFNALRRELFETSWHLMENNSEIKEEYRITEQQITRYNEVLLDTDCLRRYERLTEMKKQFQAYPQFLYYLGHAANELSQKKVISGVRLSDEQKEKYKEEAIESFSELLSLTANDLLRQDQVRAMAALEKFELLLPAKVESKNAEEQTDNTENQVVDETGTVEDKDSENKNELIEQKTKEKLIGLLEDAKKAAGNNYDVLELCGIDYLRLGEYEEAKKVLRMLVNEGYNDVINAQLLSSIYVSEYFEETDSNKRETIRYNYDTLATRVAKSYLFPMPAKEAELSNDYKNKLNNDFVQAQKNVLTEQYKEVLIQIAKKYSNIFDNAIPVPDDHLLKNRQDKYTRVCKAIKIEAKKGDYIDKLVGFEERMLSALTGFYQTITDLPGVEDRRTPYSKIFDIIDAESETDKTLYSIVLKIADNSITEKDIEVLFSKTFPYFTDAAFSDIVWQIAGYIEKATGISQFSDMEMELRKFCAKMGYSISDYSLQEDQSGDNIDEYKDYFDASMLFSDNEQKKAQEIRQKKIQKIKENQENLLIPDPKKNKSEMQFWVCDTNGYNEYFKKKLLGYKSTTLAVLDDQSKSDKDLLFRMRSIYQSKSSGRKEPQFLAFYVDIDTSNERQLKIGPYEVDANRVNIPRLNSLIKELKSICQEYDNGEEGNVSELSPCDVWVNEKFEEIEKEKEEEEKKEEKDKKIYLAYAAVLWYVAYALKQSHMTDKGYTEISNKISLALGYIIPRTTLSSDIEDEVKIINSDEVLSGSNDQAFYNIKHYLDNVPSVDILNNIYATAGDLVTACERFPSDHSCLKLLQTYIWLRKQVGDN